MIRDLGIIIEKHKEPLHRGHGIELIRSHIHSILENMPDFNIQSYFYFLLYGNDIYLIDVKIEENTEGLIETEKNNSFNTVSSKLYPLNETNLISHMQRLYNKDVSYYKFEDSLKSYFQEHPCYSMIVSYDLSRQEFKDKLYISLSHTDRYLLIAYSEIPIGADIELRLHRDRMDKLAKKIFDIKAYEEYIRLDAGQKEEVFYSGWCKYEAIIKLRSKEEGLNKLSHMGGEEATFQSDPALESWEKHRNKPNRISEYNRETRSERYNIKSVEFSCGDLFGHIVMEER